MLVKVTSVDAIAIVTALKLYQEARMQDVEADPDGAVADTEHITLLIDRFTYVKENDDSPNDIGSL